MAIFNKNKEGDQSKEEMDTLIERLGTTLEEKVKAHLAPIVETVNGLNKKWTDLEAEAAKGNEPPPIDESTLTPEQKQQKDTRALLQLNIATNARLTEAECLADVSEDWRHLIPAIKAAFAATGVEHKARADYRQACDRIVTLFIGDEAKKGGLRRSQDGTFYIEDSGGKSESAKGVLNNPELAWTDASGRVVPPEETLRKMGIDPEAFAKGMEN